LQKAWVAQADLDQAVSDSASSAAASTRPGRGSTAQKSTLDYANIMSPITGVVINRAVDVGQTVAAELQQRPTIFTIADDLFEDAGAGQPSTKRHPAR